MRFVVDDGDTEQFGGNGISAQDDITLSITPRNDNPAISNFGFPFVYTENAIAFRIDDGNVTASDPDGPANFNNGWLTVTSTSTLDRLGIVDEGDLAGQIGIAGTSITYGGATEVFGTIAGLDTGSLTITFNNSGRATPTAVTALLKALTFASDDDAPPASRTVTATLNDGSIVLPGALSGAGAATITFAPVNDAPAFAGLGGTRTYVPGGASIALDDNAAIVDPELDAAITSWVGVQIEVKRQGAADSEDRFYWSGNPTTGVTGTLTITMPAGATKTTTEAALRSIRYSNDDTATPPSSVDIQFIVRDGNTGAAGRLDQGSEGEKSGTGQVTVTLAFVNRAPSIDNLDGETLNYSEGATTPIDVSPAATITDPDGAADFNGGSLSVTLAAPVAAGEVLSVLTNTAITLTGANVAYNGDVIGTIAAPQNGTNGNPLVINFTTAFATDAAVEALLRRIAYTSGAAPVASRTVSFVFNDGDGNANSGSATSAAATVTISIAATNNAPVIANLGGDTLVYTENAGAVPIDNGDAVVTDPDSTFSGGSLSVSLSITPAPAPAQDALGIRNEGTSSGQIGVNGANVTYGGSTIGTFSSTGTSLTVNVTTGVSAAAMTALVRAITYTNSSDVPASATRTATFTLNDGAANSAGYVVTINVAAVNDAPSFANLGGSHAYTLGAASIALDTNATAADPELQALDNWNGAKIEVHRLGGQHADDLLTATGFTSSGGKLTITFGANTTTAAVAALLQSIRYANNNLAQPPATITLLYTLYDGNTGTAQGSGGEKTATGQVSVTFPFVNRAPSIDNLDGETLNYSEGATTPIDVSP
ncbi:MAG TPA: hypothetical protein VEU30_10370, partial [Thermoanaerobaculia bacterium]|nr:hypothetical protein [Thermoanaerobaculia bacterium]